jgi:hypothetical protein
MLTWREWLVVVGLLVVMNGAVCAAVYLVYQIADANHKACEALECDTGSPALLDGECVCLERAR